MTILNDHPECQECEHRMVQIDMLDTRYSYIAGCDKLTKKEWKKGNRIGTGGVYHQQKCPLVPS